MPATVAIGRVLEGQALATLVFVLSVNFLMFRILPGDPVSILVRSQRLTEQDVRQLVRRAITDERGGMSGRKSGQRVEGWSNVEPFSSPGCWTEMKSVLPSGVNAGPQTSQPRGAGCRQSFVNTWRRELGGGNTWWEVLDTVRLSIW